LGALLPEEPMPNEGVAETTLGRVLLNQVLPQGFPFVDSVVIKSDIRLLIEVIIERYPRSTVAETLDGIKELGFTFASKAGLTIALDDVRTPDDKAEILEEYEQRAEKVQGLFQKGVVTDDERRQELIEIWTEATEKVTDAMKVGLKSEQFNSLDMMVGSGARGNMMQVRQIAGMRGLVANPKGDIIPRPIISNFREGLSVLEYFISTHGARKGLADTALRTADSGYLTRRLVDVSQEMIVLEEDCETDKGIVIDVIDPQGEKIRNLRSRTYGRALADDLKEGRTLVSTIDGDKLRAGTVIGTKALHAIEGADVESVRVRSPLTCDTRNGVCQVCYGLSLATGNTVEIGEAVGIMAAQSIGEPGTQLTMRTFHTGGVAGEDITHGLPRVVELFEARAPKGKAVLAEEKGTVRLLDDEEGRRIVVDLGGDEEIVYGISRFSKLRFSDGDDIEAGTQLTDGPLDPKEVLEIRGVRAAQQYLVDQVQEVYKSQGVEIHDKHIEMIVRQMLRRVRVVAPNESDFLPAALIDDQVFRDTNRDLVTDGKKPAEGRPELMGITKASLATDSWLSAASFQETTRVLTDAAIQSRSDFMRGLKENVIIGKLIPAGTGAQQYQVLHPALPGATSVASIGFLGEAGDIPDSDEGLPEDPAEWLASLSGSVPEATDEDE
jgi:DNA-directed RNA polymerase subunit beta'